MALTDGMLISDNKPVLPTPAGVKLSSAFFWLMLYVSQTYRHYTRKPEIVPKSKMGHGKHTTLIRNMN